MQSVGVDWSRYKIFLDERSIPTQWLDIDNVYHLKVFDGLFSLSCIIEKDSGSDQTDFETNYKDAGNQPPVIKSAAADAQIQNVTKDVTSTGDYLEINTNGASQLAFAVVGSFSGLVAAYASVDGSFYQNIPLFSWDDFSKQIYSGDNNIYSVNIGGFKSIRIKMVSLGSGTPTIKAWITLGPGPNIVISPNSASFKTQSWMFDGSGSAISKGQTTMSGSVPVVMASNQSSIKFNSNYSNRNDTFTATGNGTTVDISTSPMRNFSIQLKGTGASALLWDVRLEGSLDGTNFQQILQHTNASGDGAVIFSGSSSSPVLYFRSRCAGLTLTGATNIVVTILGMN